MELPGDTASTTFGLLPNFGPRSIPFTASMAANFIAAATFIFVTMSGIHEHTEIPKYETNAFVFPVAESPRLEEAPKPIIKTPAIPARTVTLPRITPKTGPAPRLDMAAGNFANTPLPSLPAPQPRVISTVRAPAAAQPLKTVTTKPVFGVPLGVVPNANANRPATAPAVGGFRQAIFDGQGAASQPSGSAQSVSFNSGIAKDATGSSGGSGSAKSVEFGSGVGSPSGIGTQHGSIGGTNFNSVSPVATSIQLAGTSQDSSFVSPIVTFEPHPRYTTEARQLKVQGEVVFEVRLTATGKIEVLRKVSGLGHGLDEEALDVIRHIQFQPAIKNGQPADQVTLVHVSFRLA